MRITTIAGASLALHMLLLWGAAVLLRPLPAGSALIVYAVDIAEQKKIAPQPWTVPPSSPRLPPPVPRLGGRPLTADAQPADSLSETARSGTETGRARAATRRQLTAGGDLDEMRSRPYDHPTRNSPQRIRTAKRAVTHDNRRATPNPDQSAHLVTGRGDSERRSRRRARVSAAGPKAERGAQSKRRGGALALAWSGEHARRDGQTDQQRKVERMTKLPLDGEVAPRRRRPRVDKGVAASETRRKRQDVADSRDRRQASSQRRPDLLDMARASGKGKAKGKGRGSRAGRRGAPQGRRRGETVWLNTRDRRYVAYFRRIHRKIQPLWKFPKSLEIRMEQGDVLVEFTLRADGSLSRLGVRRGSGYTAFDKNALDAVRKAAPFPRVPSGLGVPLTVLAPFEFSNPLIR